MRLMNPQIRDFAKLREEFRWPAPANYNIAHEVCCRHQRHAERTALYCENETGAAKKFTFGDIHQMSSRLANALTALGVTQGDSVGIILPQRPEAALAHLAAYKKHAVALPLSVLFGPDALRYRLQDSGAKLVFTDSAHVEMVRSLAGELPQLKTVVDCDREFDSLLQKSSARFTPPATPPDTPALLIYTSGTTGPPKGALIAHRCLLGNLPGFELSHNFFPHDGDLFWTPADWAWTGGLLDALLPAWNYGVPVLGYEGGKFDPERACQLLKKYRVRNAFIPPTALKMMRQVSGNLRASRGVELRSVMSAGETLGAGLFHWGRESLGLDINEMWAQTEFNYIVGNCAAIMPVRPGSIGKPYPGHRVAPLSAEGEVLPAGETGELCAHRDDPVLFLQYWNREQATREKFFGAGGAWFGTGDMGYCDEDGYLWFVGREDDVISSAGYRIGPGEIEDTLLKHPAVAHAAVIGVPDELRGSVVKAFIVPAAGHAPSEELKEDIRRSVRERLAAYEYPREIEFLSKLPLTTTGKVRRAELRRRESRPE